MASELKTEQVSGTSTKFFTNAAGNSLYKKFKGAFEHIAGIYAFHAVAGYFRASGYYAIREHLLKVPEVKILVGINVDVISAEAKRRGLLFFGDPEKSRDEFVRWMREDIKQADYTKEVEDGIMQFMEDIIEGKIQIWIHKTKKLHAKIYIENYILDLSAENPRNQVFSPEDFDPEFLPLLQNDLQHITEISAEWHAVQEDPKLDRFLQLLKNELLRKDLNPTGKLVIFTESKETAGYLASQLKTAYPKIPTVSGDNRRTLFDLIQRNFDANYPKEFEHEYDFLISTEVLAEGVNLHRANVIINYDTPWNATRLMQRIGRVNRIGSIAEVIYNYAFYPSKQSDQLINLYNNAYIKLQGFHTALGEDARIYTTEEVLEQVKLHTLGLGEDEDKRLIYLRFIREFKERNDKEFKKDQKPSAEGKNGTPTQKAAQRVKGRQFDLYEIALQGGVL